jgi:hypothetical protein
VDVVLHRGEQPFAEGRLVVKDGERGTAVVEAREVTDRSQCGMVDDLARSGSEPTWSNVPAFSELAPYNVVVVELDEDPTIRLVGNLLAATDGQINQVDPATITIGEAARVVFQPAGEDVVLPRWVRA